VRVHACVRVRLSPVPYSRTTLASNIRNVMFHVDADD